jgi:hypothetical protein
MKSRGTPPRSVRLLFLLRPSLVVDVARWIGVAPRAIGAVELLTARFGCLGRAVVRGVGLAGRVGLVC